MKHQNLLEILEDGKENIPDSAWGKRRGPPCLADGVLWEPWEVNVYGWSWAQTVKSFKNGQRNVWT